MKLSHAVIDKTNMATLTPSGMKLFLHLAKRQDIQGNIVGVHHNEVTKYTGMVKQSFYNALYELKDKEIITYSKVSDGSYYNVKILDNDFSNGKKDFKRGYIDLSRSVFHKKSFKKLKSHEVYLMFQLMKRTHASRNAFKIMPKTFYDKYTKLFNVTKRVVRSYLHNIKKFFSIGIVRGLYFITYKHSVFKDKAKPERYFRDKGTALSIIRQLKIKKYSEKELEEITELLYQYRNMCNEKNEKIETILLNVLWQINKDKQLKERKLDYKYANKLIHNHLVNGDEIEEFKPHNRFKTMDDINKLELIMLRKKNKLAQA